MTPLMLLLWVWVISGGIALFIYSDEVPKKVDLLTVAFLVLSWPWWVSQLKAKKNKEKEKKLVPVRIETRDHIPKGK